MIFDGSILKKVRARRGYTQMQLLERLDEAAERLGQDKRIAQQTLSNWETGKVQPKSENVELLAAVLEVPAACFYPGITESDMLNIFKELEEQKRKYYSSELGVDLKLLDVISNCGYIYELEYINPATRKCGTEREKGEPLSSYKPGVVLRHSTKERPSVLTLEEWMKIQNNLYDYVEFQIFQYKKHSGKK